MYVLVKTNSQSLLSSRGRPDSVLHEKEARNQKEEPETVFLQI